MLFRLGVILLLLAAGTAFAQTPLLRDITVPYEVMVLDTDPEVRQTLLSTLEGYPDMYEVVSATPFTLTLHVKQLATSTPTAFSLLVVQENENGRGVKEVERLTTSADEGWTEVYDSQLALTLLESELIDIPLEAGIYRFEISTPINLGQYMVEMGRTDTQDGYLASLSRVMTIYDFFGVSSWRILQSSLVFYPIMVLALVVLSGISWIYRDRLWYGNT